MLTLSTPLDLWTPLKKFPVSPSSLHRDQYDADGEGLVERRWSSLFWVFYHIAQDACRNLLVHCSIFADH